MLEIFRSNTIVSVAGFVLFTLLIRMGTLIHPIPVEPVLSTPFAQIIFDWLREHQLFSVQNQVLAILMVLLHGFLLNYISSSHNILYKNTVLPGLFYVLLNSIYPEQLQLTPQLISNTFILLLLNRLCFLYESERPLFLVFDAGVLLGLGLLLDYDLIVYLPFILLSVLYMTSFNLRYWLVAIFGIVLPAYFLGVMFYLSDHLRDFLSSFEMSLHKSYFHSLGITLKEGIIWLFIGVSFFFSVVSLQVNFLRNRVKTRRIQLIVLVMMLFGVISVLAENQGYIFGITFLAVSLCILLANYFVRSERKWMKEFLFFGMIGCILFYQYFNH